MKGRLSVDIDVARSIQKAARGHLSVRTATKEIHQAVDLLAEALNELEQLKKKLTDLQDTMTH